jgi:hypothetical protein
MANTKVKSHNLANTAVTSGSYGGEGTGSLITVDPQGRITAAANVTLGFRNIPAIGTKTSSYELTTADVGKYVQVGTGGSITIPDATFAEGDAVNIFNNTSGSITITCSITISYIAGTDSDVASVTLSTRGMATILFISSTVCVIAGNIT